MKHSIPHTLARDMAQQAARCALDAYANQLSKYAPKVNWISDDAAQISFSVRGFSLQGDLRVTGTAIDIDLDVPFVLRPFKKKAIEVIEREVANWLQKADRGEL